LTFVTGVLHIDVYKYECAVRIAVIRVRVLLWDEQLLFYGWFVLGCGPVLAGY